MSTKAPVEKVSVTIEVWVDQDWIDYCVESGDLFMSGYCGYWLAGMEHDHTLGYLCYEYDIGGGHNPSLRWIKNSPEYPAIVQAWKDGKSLPARFYRLDKEAAIRAYKFGVEKYGVDWFENADAINYDSVIQLALLGEITYC